MVSLWFPWQLIFGSGYHGEHEEGPRCQHFEKKYLGAVHCWYKLLALTTDAAVIIVTFGGGSENYHFCMPQGKSKFILSDFHSKKKSHLYFFIASIMDQTSLLHCFDNLLFSLFYAKGWFSWGSLFTINFIGPALVLRSSETPLKVVKLITHTHNLQKHLSHPKFSSQLKLVSLSPFLFYLGAQVYVWG